MTPRPDRWFFDVWSRFYDTPWVQRAAYHPVHDAVLRTLRRTGVRSVLDVGCGTGQLAVRLKEAFPQARVVGCDFSTGMLHEAVSRGDGIHWVRGDALQLPLRDETFDAVVSTEAFHWFPDQARALAEFRRVLTPGGRVLVALINPRWELLSRVSRLGSHLVGEPFYWPTETVMREQVRAAGLRVRAQRHVSRLPGVLLFPAVLTVAQRP